MNAKYIEIRESNTEVAKAYDAAKETLYNDFNIVINHADAIPTIAYCFLKEAAMYLSSEKKNGEDTRLNLFDLVTFGINFTDTEDDEKMNNFEPTVIVGNEMAQIIEDTPEDNEDDEEE